MGHGVIPGLVERPIIAYMINNSQVYYRQHRHSYNHLQSSRVLWYTHEELDHQRGLPNDLNPIPSVLISLSPFLALIDLAEGYS